MKDSKVARLLRCLNDNDLKRLRALVGSPFFRSGRDLTRFLDVLSAFHPSYNREDFTAGHIYGKLYPGTDYDEKLAGNTIRVLSSELHSACKEYLIQKGLEEDVSRKKYYLLEKLRELKLYKEFMKEFNTDYSGQDDIYRGGVHDMLNKFYLEHSFLEFNVDNQDAQSAFNSIITVGEYAAAAALILGFRNPDLKESCIRYNCEFRDNLLDDMFNCMDLEKFIGLTKVRNDKFSICMTVNYLIRKMCTDTYSSDAYFELKKLYKKYLELTGHQERYYVLNIMLSYCTRESEHTSDDRFIKDEFLMVSNIVEYGTYKFRQSDSFNPSRFRAFVLIAFDNDEFQWLEKFIEDHIDELDAEERSNMKNYALGVLSFANKNFEQALTCFAKVEPTVFLFKRDIRHFRMMIYYELGQQDALHSLIDSSKHYVKSSKELSDHMRICESNFLNFLTELLRMSDRGLTSHMDELRIRMENEIKVSSRKWLLEKVDELQN